MEYMQKYVKEQGDTSLCNVNKTVKGPDHPGARVAVKRQEQLGVSSSGTTRPFSRPRGWVEFASSDRTRGAGRACCGVTAQAREEEHKTPQQQAPPDMQTSQSFRACLRRGVPADHEAHSRSGDSCEESQRLSFCGTASPEAEAGESQTMAANHDRPTRRCSGRADSCRAATWDDLRHKAGRGGRTTVDDRAKQSRAKPDERRSVQTFEAEAPATRCSQRRTRVATDTAWRSSRPA